MSPKNPFEIDLSFIGLMISVVVCVIMLFAFLQALIKTNSAIVGSRGQIMTGNGLSVDKSSIDWGTLYPDSNGTEVINIKNKAAFRQTLLFFTSDWVPVNASKYLTFSWNYSGAVLQPSQQIPVELRLYVHPDIQGIYNFTFNINIQGT